MGIFVDVLKTTLKVLTIVLLTTFILMGHTKNVSALACTTAANCTNYCHPDAGCTGETVSCVNRLCTCTWLCSCDCGWGSWGNCNSGYMRRYCSCNASLSQIAQCCSPSWETCSCSGTQSDGCGNSRGCTPPNTCCSSSAPTISSLTKISSSTWRLSWSGGSGNTRNVYIGTSQSAVESNCPSGCALKAEGLASSTTTADVSGLSAGTFYYSRVVAYNDAGCNSPSATNTAISSCDISPSSLTIEVGQSAVLTTIANSLGAGTVSYSRSAAFINPPTSPDSSYPYTTTITGASDGIATVTNTIASPVACTGSSTIRVINPGPWWQVVDGDVTTNGDLLNGVPFVGSLYMSASGPGGYPGIPAYGGTTDVASDKISETGWIANTTTNATKVFNSTFFSNSIPSDVTPTQVPSSTEDGTTFTTLGTEEYGYYWYEYDALDNGGADLTITSSFDVGSRKVILLVKGADVIIQGDINLTDGSGFFLMVAGEDSLGNGGNILVDSGVGGSGPNLEGIYVSDNQFSTGVAATQLYIHGTVAAYGGISLERDLGGPTNATTPAEVFEYAPELELLYPSKLGTRAINWQEVAP